MAFLGNYFGARFTSGSYNVVQSEQFTAKGTGVLSGYSSQVQLAAGRGVVQLAGLSSTGVAPNGKTNKPFGTAAPAMVFPVSLFPAVQPANETPSLGISVTGDAKHKGFKSIALGYSLSQDAKSDSTVGLLKSVMGFFGVKTAAPLSSSKPVIFHSAIRDRESHLNTPVTAVVVGAGSTPVVLHYRRHGQGGYYAVAMTKGSNPGTYSAIIPSNAVTADGVDYWISAGSVSSPLRAQSGAYAHAIGVHIPEVFAPMPILKANQVVSGEATAVPPGAASGGLPATGSSPYTAGLAVLLLAGAAVAVRQRRSSH